ncbi:MAG: hypothetical protein LBV26_05055, partial [Bacteroidales bacterium]|nr:hypothetical protein [Bacteroidales bacterium]
SPKSYYKIGISGSKDVYFNGMSYSLNYPNPGTVTWEVTGPFTVSSSSSTAWVYKNIEFRQWNDKGTVEWNGGFRKNHHCISRPYNGWPYIGKSRVYGFVLHATDTGCNILMVGRQLYYTVVCLRKQRNI